MDIAGKRVLVMGLGHHGGGVAVTRFLRESGAVVTVTDMASAESLSAPLARLADLRGVEYRLGAHDQEDFERAEVIVVNPAVKPGNAFVERARSRGARITSEIELLLERAPARIIGVTGSVGKSTTATMIDTILRVAGLRSWLGGNIGHSLLADLPSMTRRDWAVVELSSFQLHWLSPGARMPDIAVVTNCVPNHLDWHGTFGEYALAKRRIVEEQSRDGVAIFDSTDAEVARWRSAAKGRVVDIAAPAIAADMSWLGKESKLMGLHNQRNARLAAAAARAVGVDDHTIRTALDAIEPLPHRIALVAEIDGRRYVNDSKSTTPAATKAAIDAFPHARLWLLAGGRSKGVDLADLADHIAAHVHGGAFFGEACDTFFHLVGQRVKKEHLANFARTADMATAFDWCHDRGQPGDVVLLSPACASFDQFHDFEDRGRRFAQLVEGCRLPPPQPVRARI